MPLTTEQLAAANPAQSVWVSANAGTGKTFVLAIRLLRLLLNDNTLEPLQILAVTFTNAAATEMLNRFLKLCRELAHLTDAEIAEKLDFYGLQNPTPAHLARAKSLFALCQASPPNITTLNGFCQSLLQQFPLEAGLSPNFELLDEPTASQLQSQTMQACLRDWGTPSHPLHPHFVHLCDYTSDYAWLDTLKLCITERARLGRLLKAKGPENLLAELAEKQEISAADTWPALQTAQQALVSEILYADLRQKLEDLPYAHKESRKSFEQKLAECLNFPPSYARYVAVYQDSKGNITDKAPLASKKPHADFFAAQKEALANLESRAKGALVHAHTEAFLRLGQAFAEAYAAAKRAQNVVDFDDQIILAHTLLTASSARAWVAYKLDGGYGHILLDEGQDIDHNQKQLVETLADAFGDDSSGHHDNTAPFTEDAMPLFGDTDFSPQGANSPKTLFAVGDMKQSIYRFRGAQPPAFMGLGNWLHTEKNGEKVMMQESFRSASAILKATDQTFAQQQAALTGSDVLSVAHTAYRSSLFGQVTLWAPEADLEKQQKEPWMPPTYEVQESGMLRLGERIAQQIGRMVGQTVLGENPQEGTASEARLANFRDCLILVRSWGSATPITAALSAAGIPFVLGKPEDPLETPLGEDVLALVNWAVNPHNNLAFVSVLKGVFVGWPDDKVRQFITEHTAQATAHATEHNVAADAKTPRHKQPLWPHLASFDAPLCEQLSALLALQNPADLFHQLRSAWQVARHAKNRFGAGADALFEGFVQAAESATGNLAEWLLQLETVGLGDVETPQLIGSLHEAESNNAVRILSAHGAKGLEAPIVFLPDTHPPKGKTSPLLWEQDAQGNDHAVALPLGTETDYITSLKEAEKTRSETDALRLLYVALTRAEQFVFVGTRSAKEVQPSKDGSPKTCWYTAVLAAATEENGWQQHEETGDWVLAENTPAELSSVEKATAPAPTTDGKPALPSWVSAPFPQPDAKAKQVQSAAQARGERIHDALALLANGLPLTEETLPDEAAEAEGVMQAFGHLLQQAQFEKPLAWLNDDGFLTHGRLDALVETAENELLVIDFKTDAAPSDADTRNYRAQVAGYMRALAEIHEKKAVKGAILWTRTQKLDYITP